MPKSETVNNKKRYPCFTEQQQELFDGLNRRQQAYVIFRSQGYDKRNSYKQAGYKDSKVAGQAAWVMECRTYPFMADLINALAGHQRRIGCYKENTPQSKIIDEKVEELPIELAKIPYENKTMEQTVNDKDLMDITREDADRLQFYRRIANGTTPSKKVTKMFDKDGNLKSTKVEETYDIDTRIKARKEIDRILGINDMLQVGDIQAGEINIMIVDATKKDLDDSDKQALDKMKEVEEVEVKDDGRNDEQDGNDDGETE